MLTRLRFFHINFHLLVALSFALSLAGPAAPVQAGTLTVTNTDDSGPGSLRQAMLDAESNPGTDTIVFDISGCGAACTIQPLSPLPNLSSGGTTVDGYSQPGAVKATESVPAVIKIEINGISLGSESCFYITSGVNVIQGLAINRCPNNGVHINTDQADGNQIAGNHIGLDPAGDTKLENTYDGVYIAGGADDNVIGGTEAWQRNVISGNGWEGVGIFGSGTTNNVVSNNYIGTDATGLLDLGNNHNGVQVYGGAQDNQVYGQIYPNVISGNQQNGVQIAGGSTMGNRVYGNYIGLDKTGLAARANSGSGVYIGDGAHNTLVGGQVANGPNVISGNLADGIRIEGEGTDDNVIAINYIGTDKDGAAAIGNGDCGVRLYDHAQENWVGIPQEGKGNLISGNGSSSWAGVLIAGDGTDGNLVQGNLIGLNAAGDAALGNAYGVRVTTGAQGNIIGGPTDGERNVISGNNTGIWLEDEGTDLNTIQGNYIGTDPEGLYAIPNTSSGIRLLDGPSDNLIGGDAPEARNIVSGNTYGIFLDGAGTTSNVVSGNYIGVSRSGKTAIGNTSRGILIQGGASNNTIGGSLPGERNVISGNGTTGVNSAVYIGGSASNNTVLGNYIGPDVLNQTLLGDTGVGIRIDFAAHDNTIGPHNVIAGNSSDGVYVYDTGTNHNTITLNSIHSNSGDGIDLVAFGNDDLDAPTITGAFCSGRVIGETTCLGCLVEVFSDSEDEGRFPEGNGYAAVVSPGTFDLTFPINGPHITATVTDADGNTSEFSAPYDVGVCNNLPTADMDFSPSSGDRCTVFTFDGTGSSDVEDPLFSLDVRWDWNNDGLWDTSWSTSKVIEHRFLTSGLHQVHMQVRDTGGLTDVDSKLVSVSSDACQTFDDVPYGNWAWEYVEGLAAAGITSGCGGGNYCPLLAVSRAQMAKFLLVAEHGSGYTPPAGTGTMFGDVPPGHLFVDWIEQLANEGITSGCGGGNYCPDLPVSRAQMAKFLLLAEHGSGYTPPAGTGTMFGDVPPGHLFVDWIEQLANEMITSGCGGGNYCPDLAVARDQMAVFLVRTFDLPTP